MKGTSTQYLKCIFVCFTFFSSVVAKAQNITWTWQAGSSTVNQPGIYSKTPNYNNTPGVREYAATWTDKNGNFWLFGGYGGYSTFADNGIQYFYSDMWEFNPTTTEWVWVSGSDSYNVPGVYGQQGKADADNLPGSRGGAATWVDSAGNFWLFGGLGYDSTTNIAGYNGTSHYLNDLWMYSPKTNEWTWVGGTPASNQNGSYGRENKSTGGLPGGRYQSYAATDGNGTVWLFGGWGYDQLSSNSDQLNDFWQYQTSANTWIWEGGSTQQQQEGNYGTKGTAALTNIPGSRYGGTAFCDTSGNFWIYAGQGYTGDEGDNDGYIDDLWKYTPSNSEWTWISGSNQGNQRGVYDKLGSSNPFNIPGGRANPLAWLDSSKNLWVFGGYGFASSALGDLNDLWEYSLKSNQWAWMNGDSTSVYRVGTYATGSEGTGSTSYIPGSRYGGSTWIDASGNLWLFGGSGVAAVTTSYQAFLNDVWEATNPVNALPVTLLNLKGTEKGGENILNWQTATEINSAYFNIQRSGTGQNFTTIGTVAAAGNSNALLDYTYIDASPLQGNNLYRLKMVDKDGNFKYSNIVAIDRSLAVNLKVYPNPTTDALKVDGLDQFNTSYITVFDNTGRKLSTTAVMGSNYMLNVKQLAAGTYYVQVVSDKTNTTLKFIKQ